LVSVAEGAASPVQALELLSREISGDAALASMRIHDQELLVAVLSHAENPLYLSLAQCLYELVRTEAGTGIAMRWLLGQAMQPLTEIQSREQARALVQGNL